ncbi:uncharacterized protein ISCGN_001186 [Ixodes scapularis]
MASSSHIGQVEAFDKTVSDWQSYEERLTSFFLINKIPDDLKVHAFLSVIGPKTYSLLKSLTAPAKPSENTLEQLTQLLRNQLSPRVSVIGERAKFHRRSQLEHESIAQYVAELRKLSQTCEFGGFLDESLRDRFVCGLFRADIQRYLFAEDKTLTFQKAVERALALEEAKKNVQEAHAKERSDDLHKMSTEDSAKRKQSFECYRCGSDKHFARACPHIADKCMNCGKKGHVQRACRSAKKKTVGGKKWVRTLQSDDTFNVQMLSPQSRRPITVDVEVQGTSLSMELDTGATVSIIPKQQFKKFQPPLKLEPTELRLKTYTGEVVQPCGFVKASVRYKGQEDVLPLYVVDHNGPPLLGREWLTRLRLDWDNICGVHKLSDSHRSDASKKYEARLKELQAKYSRIFDGTLGKIEGERATLFLKEQRPKFLKARNVPYALRSAVEEELQKLEQMGVIKQVSTSEFATPIVPVVKKDGTIRVCGDYKTTLNPVLDTEQYPLPKLEEILAALAGGKYFSKLDLSRAYQQVEMSEDSKKLLTLNTHKGLFAVNRLPFGVASAPALFQRIMDNILKGLPGVICYLDDILVTGATAEEHLRNLEAVFCTLQQKGVRVKREKCEFFKESLQYLGHIISETGVKPSEEKVQALLHAPAPTNIAQLRSLLGLINYYGKFTPRLATLAKPFYRLLQKDAPWCWNRKCQDAFQAIKEILSSTEVLAHYDPARPLQLSCDASAYGLGAVLSHVMKDGTVRPIAYASRTLSKAEENYSQIEKEALALIFGVKKFHFYIYGREFTLITDHKPLQAILGPKSGIPAIAAARLQRWAVTLSAYKYKLAYRTSAENADADCFSRLPLQSTEVDDSHDETFYTLRLASLPVTSRDIARHTERDPVLSLVVDFTKKGWPSHLDDKVLKPYFDRRRELTVHERCLMHGMRVVVPPKLQQLVLEELHQGHPGIVRSKALARSYVWWPSLETDLENQVRHCTACQQQRHMPEKAPLHPWSWPTQPWSRVHVDFAGPLRGRMLLVIVDAHSKWPEVFVMTSTTAEATITKLRDLFARYGAPEALVSDNGAQFTSSEFKEFLKEQAVRQVLTSAYHPSSNGLAERFVQTLKNALRKGPGTESMEETLSKFLMTYRNTPHATTQETPSFLFLGRRPRTRLDALKPALDRTIRARQFEQTSRRRGANSVFEVNDEVFVRNFRSGPTWFHATVLQRTGPVSYVVKVRTPDGLRTWRRHKDHLRSASTAVTAPSLVGEDDTDTIYPASEADVPPPSTVSARQTVPVTPTNAAPRRYPQRQRRPPDRYEAS